MQIDIYDCVTGDPLTVKYGPTGDIVARWIAPHLPEAAFRSRHVAGGAALAPPSETDGIIISGSEQGVYDTPGWMAPLRQNLLAHKDAGTPLFGICFGHQLMADVFGGRAEKVDSGFAAGARSFEIRGAPAPAFVAHQDQVTKVPPGARVIASAPYCPVGALDYDFPARSVQFHPEHDAPFSRDVIDLVTGELLTPEGAQAARESTQAEVSKDLFAAEVAAFFRAQAR